MKRFKCPNCDQKFSIEQKDFEEYYSKIESIQCTYCGKTFNLQHAISLSCDEPKVENKKLGCGCLIFIVIAIYCIIVSCQSSSSNNYIENKMARDRHIEFMHKYIENEIDRREWIYISPWTGKLVCPYCEDPGLHKRDEY
jgi:uncharacterized Zn-finger protein